METNITPEFLQAFAKFQELCPTIEKSSKGQRGSYASLPDIIERVRPFLKESGLILTQLVSGSNEVKVVTILAHSSGKGMMVSELSMAVEHIKIDKTQFMQAVGIAITYMKRYCISAILNIVTDSDTDGERFLSDGEKEAKKASITPEQIKITLTKISEAKGLEAKNTILKKALNFWKMEEATENILIAKAVEK